LEDRLLIDIGIPAAAALVALLIGFSLGRTRKRPGPDEADWRVRLAARDRDLLDATERLVDAELALQEVLGHATAPTLDAETAAQVSSLTEELQEAEDELMRLRSLGVDRTPAGGSIARRLETLEAELATLESMRCPDPAAHRHQRSSRRTPSDPVTPDIGGDDLTMITGVGPGLAEIFRGLGYQTFEAVARLTDDDLASIAELTGGVAGPAAREGWVQSARRLADERTDAA